MRLLHSEAPDDSMGELTQLGHYDVVGRLGAGGMGEVYRALDTRLGREVALKLLPGDLRQAEALERFEREARALAALNHPNVATLYSFEESGDARFLVMELVEGQPLSHRLAAGPISVAETVRLAVQVADALHAAHERNIVHRDLKPSNVMVLPTGVAKLLDFGIALLKPRPDEQTADDAATLDRLTGTHQIVGTPAYMSPEQIRGRDLDARSDIWSFGCVLFEMLAGERLYAYETAADTMAAILGHDPELKKLPEDVPAAFHTMLRRCLQRDLDSRAGDIWHVRRELEDAGDSLGWARPARLCLRCGLDNSPEARYCGHCGASLLAECPDCGAAVGADARFCSACGTAVAATDEHETLGAAPESVEPESERPDTLSSLAAERRYLTLVEFGLAGHSELMENLPPSRLQELVADVHETIESAARERDGTVLSLQPSGATVAFGLPVSREDDARRAIATAIDAIERALQIGPEHAEDVQGDLRAGVATGACVTQRDEDDGFSVAGDPLRAAARLLDHAKPGRILIAPETARLVRRDYETEEADPLILPDADRPVRTHAVIGPAAATAEIPETPRGLTTFTGRAGELAELDDNLRAATRGEGRVVTLVGEAGLGKSRLLYEFARSARDEARVVYGHCRADGRATPYLPFLDMLRALLLPEDDGAGADDETVAANLADLGTELADFLPVYLHLLSVPTERYPLPDYIEERHISTAIQQALAAILTQASDDLPVALILEDWHWADEASRDVARQLGTLVPGFAILLVISYRPEYREDWSRLPQHAAIHLKPLQEDASADLMRSVLKARSLPADLVDLVHARTGGNPFFLEEICRTLVEKENLRVEDGQVVLDGRLQDIELPETIQAVIRARLDRLEPFVVEVARVASVIGREFDRALLEHVLDDRERSLDRALDALQETGLARQARVIPEVVYRFQHALIQDVAYDSLLRHQRRSLHGLVAEAIEALRPERREEHADLLADHFGRAGHWHKAIHYGQIAARRARSVSQFAESVNMLERIEGWLGELTPEERDRRLLVDILMRKERMYETLGRRDRQLESIERLLELLEGEEATTPLAEAHLRLGDFYATIGRFEQGLEALDPVLDWARDLGDRDMERRAFRSLGFLEWQRGSDERARELIDEAIAIDRERDEEAELAHDLTNYAAILRETGDNERALQLLKDAMEIYERLGLQWRLISPLHVSYTLYRQMGELGKATEALERARDLGRSTSDTLHLHWELGHLGNIHLQQGDEEQAFAAFEEAIHCARSSGFAHGLSMSLRAMGDGLLMVDRPGEALPYLREAAEQFASTLDVRNEARTWSDIATAYTSLGQLADATAARELAARRYREAGAHREELDALMELAETTREHEMETSRKAFEEAVELAAELGERDALAEALNSLGILHWREKRLERALEAYESALEVYEELEDTTHEGLILNSLGAVLRDLERDDEAEERFSAALELNRASGERLLQAHSLAGLGDLAARSGEDDEAARHYATSLRLREELDDLAGAAWMALKIGEALARAGDPAAASEYAAKVRDYAAEVGDPTLIARLERFEAATSET